jgi:hypothetical protein
VVTLNNAPLELKKGILPPPKYIIKNGHLKGHTVYEFDEIAELMKIQHNSRYTYLKELDKSFVDGYLFTAASKSRNFADEMVFTNFYGIERSQCLPIMTGKYKNLDGKEVDCCVNT